MHLLVRLAACLALAPATAWAQDLTADMIEKMGNNTLFTRWRPMAHFIAPAGWMNDPCGMMYDPSRDIYHLMYQWHPNHVNWGNISWGHATSKDMITWTDVGGWHDNEALALGTGPVGSYNGLGAFSGTAQPVNLQGEQNGDLTIFYTSVSKLPTSWTLPYLPHTESQSIATSTDGGVTWQNYEDNPVIFDHPAGWNITGWRDPFVEAWPEMDELLGQTEPHYYSVFGSGIKEVGPRIPLYSAPASDLTQWTFLGALWEPAANTSLGSVLETGSYGFNFEVSNFFSIADDCGEPHYFVSMGTEGGNVSFHENQHWSLWNGGPVSRRANGSVEFEPAYGGAADWGNLYAMTSFYDAKTKRRVQWGWAPEDMNDFGITQQGFQGAMALPRELFVHKTTGVDVAHRDLSTPGNSLYESEGQGTYGAHTATTLGTRPLADVVAALRAGSTKATFKGRKFSASKTLDAAGSAHLELTATFAGVKGRAGVTVGKSPSGEEYTNIYYDSAENTVTVDRAHSSQIKEFLLDPVIGFFEPYTLKGAGKEAVTMDVFLDGSLLEVYVNSRFALTTRIYPSREDSTGYGVFVGKGSSATVSDVASWKGLKNVFPGRPRDSSSELVFDTAEETNDYTWWAGN